MAKQFISEAQRMQKLAGMPISEMALPEFARPAGTGGAYTITEKGEEVLKQAKATGKAPEGIKNSEIAALVFLFKAKKEGKRVQKMDYAKEKGVDQPAVNSIFNGLEMKELATKEGYTSKQQEPKTSRPRVDVSAALSDLDIEEGKKPLKEDIFNDIDQDLMHGGFENQEDQIEYLKEVISYCQAKINEIESNLDESKKTLSENKWNKEINSLIYTYSAGNDNEYEPGYEHEFNVNVELDADDNLIPFYNFLKTQPEKKYTGYFKNTPISVTANTEYEDEDLGDLIVKFTEPENWDPSNLDESKKILSEKRNKDLVKKWESLGPDFRFEPDNEDDENSDGVYFYKGEAILFFPREDNRLEAEVQYLDFGNTRAKGEKIIDPMINDLEKTLNKNNIDYKIMTTSHAYMIDIYM